MTLVLGFFALAASVLYIADYIPLFGPNKPKSQIEIAIQITTIALLFLLFAFAVWAFFRGLGRVLISVSNSYPNWYYFPRIEITPVITPDNSIELVISNSKSQKMSLAVNYASLDSKVKPLPMQASGISANKQLLDLDDIPGKRIVKIGRLDNQTVILSAGNGNGEMTLEKPGIYKYLLNVFGEYKGREYIGSDKITITRLM